MNDARLAYNVAVDALKEEKRDVNWHKLRDYIVTAKNSQITDQRVLGSHSRTPKDIRAKAVHEATVAHNLSIKKRSTLNPDYGVISSLISKISRLEKCSAKATKTRIKLEKEIHTIRTNLMVRGLDETSLEHVPKYMAKESNVKFRLKKAQYQHIFIPKSASSINDSKQLMIYKSWKMGGIPCKEHFDITSDFIIRKHTKLDVWEVITSYDKKVELYKAKEEDKLVSIDPGIRTFLTCLDDEGNVKEIGNRWVNGVKRHMIKADGIDLSGLKGQERYNAWKSNMCKARSRRKLHDKINDMHKKVAKDLLTQYDIIVLPKLRSKSILKKNGGLGRRINREISVLAHCKFHDYITWKATTMGKIVIDQNESYTSKTCYECGKLNDIGSKKVYSCSCGNECDRDVQASFNILTKFMGSYIPHWCTQDLSKVMSHGSTFGPNNCPEMGRLV